MIRCQNNRLVGSDTLLPDGEYVLIACSDDGEGMPESVARRAFEPLFTTKLSGSGAGLGLAQVLSMCEQRRAAPRRSTACLAAARRCGCICRAIASAARRTAASQTVVEQPALRHAGMVLLVEDNEDVAGGRRSGARDVRLRESGTSRPPTSAFDVLNGAASVSNSCCRTFRCRAS